MNRTEDGTLAREDPHAAARRIQAETHGRWVVWWGTANRRYWAMPRGGDVLVEGLSTTELIDRMTTQARRRS